MYKSECLISGETGRSAMDEVSAHIWKYFSQFFFSGFAKIGVTYVGPDAHRLLQSGFRLAQDFRFSREVDLSPIGE
jgi:hypothetical protein